MKHLAILINTLLVATTLYFCVEIIQKHLGAEADELSDKRSDKTKAAQQINPVQRNQFSQKKQYNAIAMRNLFQVGIKGEKEAAEVEETVYEEIEMLERTTLKLVLLGTVTGNATVYAVIEDKKLRHQSLHEVGDSIQEATIKRILRHKVILTYQGKDQVLEMESDDKNIHQLKKPAQIRTVTPMPADNIKDSLPVDMADVMEQIKFRPHLTEGIPDGLMVYGIKMNSIFRQMGLKNGDIVKDINGTSIVSTEDTPAFFIEINSTPDTRLTLFRRGKVKELIYQGKENERTSKGDE